MMPPMGARLRLTGQGSALLLKDLPPMPKETPPDYNWFRVKPSNGGSF